MNNRDFPEDESNPSSVEFTNDWSHTSVRHIHLRVVTKENYVLLNPLSCTNYQRKYGIGHRFYFWTTLPSPRHLEHIPHILVTDGVIRNCNACFCIPLQDRYQCNNPQLWGMSSNLTINQWIGGSNWRWLETYVFSIAIKCMLFSVELHRPGGQPTGTEISFFSACCIRNLSLKKCWEVESSSLRTQAAAAWLWLLSVIQYQSCKWVQLHSNTINLIWIRLIEMILIAFYMYIYIYIYKITRFLPWDYELCCCLLKTDDGNISELHFSELLRNE